MAFMINWLFELNDSIVLVHYKRQLVIDFMINWLLELNNPIALVHYKRQNWSLILWLIDYSNLMVTATKQFHKFDYFSVL